MRKAIIFSICFTFVTAAVIADGYAQNDPIAARQKILKSFGKTTKPVVGMLQGKTAFNLPTVQTALKTIVAGTKDLPNLFPPNSKTGEKTKALPKIWEDKTDFVRRFSKLGKDAAAAETAITDEASLKANMGKVLGNCKSCHDNYRQKL